MRLSELDRSLDALEYPITTDAIAAHYGPEELEFQDGTERLASLLGRIDPEEFDSPETARLTLYGALPEAAVGRKGYTDRDPPGLGEVDPLSF